MRERGGEERERERKRKRGKENKVLEYILLLAIITESASPSVDLVS